MPQVCKGPVTVSDKSVLVANNNWVHVYGTAGVKGRTPYGTHAFHVHLLENTSHPFIVDTGYMMSKGIVIDFCKGTYSAMGNRTKKVKVKCSQPVMVPPNAEIVIQGKVHKNMLTSIQGIAHASKCVLKSGLLLAKSVTTIPGHHVIPIKLLNPSNAPIYIHKGMVLADFVVLDEDYTVFCL